MSGTALAQAPLKNFAYVSTGCSPDGDLLTWGDTDDYRMTQAKPGAGELPAGDFWIRGISVTFWGVWPGQRVIIGHSGPNGDWISPPVLSSTTQFVSFPADAAPLFKVGEYLDAHAGCSWLRRAKVIVSIWYVPAP